MVIRMAKKKKKRIPVSLKICFSFTNEKPAIYMYHFIIFLSFVIALITTPKWI